MTAAFRSASGAHSLFLNVGEADMKTNRMRVSILLAIAMLACGALDVPVLSAPVIAPALQAALADRP